MFFYKVLRPISTTSGLKGTGLNTRKYHQIDVYIYQCVEVMSNNKNYDREGSWMTITASLA